MTESCPDHILSYQTTTLPFQTSLIDLFIPDRSVIPFQQISQQVDISPIYPFYFHFNALPFTLTKKCIVNQPSLF